jgi:hypothetical protein
MDTTRRQAGLLMAGYGLLTTAAFTTLGSPGGDYTDQLVPDYLADSHRVAGFALCYLGVAGALCLLWFGLRARHLWEGVGESVRALAVAGAAASVVGWFLDGGVLVSMAEGGSQVQTGVAHPVVYVLTETGNLLAVCAPALFTGVAALVLARRTPMPTWLRVFAGVAGVCGILAPLFFTYFVFVLWTLVFGGWMAVSGRRVETPEVQASLV